MPMFTATTPFDSDVERVTSELNAKDDIASMRAICERCQHMTNGSKDLLRAIVKRMNDKVPRVAMQSLTMLDVGVIYGGPNFRQEMASRDFISECRTFLTSGKAHSKVIKRLKHLIRKWSENEFKSDPSHSLMPSLFNSLRAEGHSFPVDEEATELLAQQECDDIEKAIALSLRDSSSKHSGSLYPSTDREVFSSSSRTLRQVRALYDFEAAEDNELTFKAGELITILDDSDANWWKGSSNRGEGLFPANFVTADLTAEPEPESHGKSRKSVRFHDEVNVQVVETAGSVDTVEVDEKKIDEALAMIQNADPTGDVDADPPELLNLEDQCCRIMGPLIDQELERIDRQHNVLVQVNNQLTEAFTMYHNLMQQLPSYVPPTAGIPQQSFDGQQAVPFVNQSFANSTVPYMPTVAYPMQNHLPSMYGPVSTGSPQHLPPIFPAPNASGVTVPGSAL